MLLLVPYHGLKYLQLNHNGFEGSAFLIHWLHMWRMPLFFAVSGFLAAMTLARWGLKRQLRSRLKRIGIPLAVGMVTVVPLIGLLAIGLSHLYFADTPRGPKPLIWSNVIRTQPMHLWFLSYLLFMSVLAAGIVVAFRRCRPLSATADRAFHRLVGSPFAIPGLALLSGLALYVGGYWRASSVVAQSLIPDPASFVYYMVFFAFGWMLYRRIDLMPKVESKPGLKLALGTVFGIVSFIAYNGRAGHADPQQVRLIVLVTLSLATWLTIFGFWGLFARLFSRERPAMRYLADASYWVFLIHVPFLTVAQVSLAQTGLPDVPRLFLAVAFALAASFATYQLFVRYTAIGNLLHGPRSRGPSRAQRKRLREMEESLSQTQVLPISGATLSEETPTDETPLPVVGT